MVNNYFLDASYYTSYDWKKAILGGIAHGHLTVPCGGIRKIVHIGIGLLECIPLVGQIISLCERWLYQKCYPTNPVAELDQSKFPKASKKSPESPKKADEFIPVPVGKGPEVVSDPKKASELSKSDKPEVPVDVRSSIFKNVPEDVSAGYKVNTFARRSLSSLHENRKNALIPLTKPPVGIDYFSSMSTFYSYNAESVDDYGWGCAWRAIQTCLSAYDKHVSFARLFHLLGPKQHLVDLFSDKHPSDKISPQGIIAPYSLVSGWAEPFIGEMALHLYNIPSVLETVNGIPACKTPHTAFHQKPLTFALFRDRMEEHFKKVNPPPLMIDDGRVAMNIIGIGRSGVNTMLWIADPHIEPRVNEQSSNEQSPCGLYTVTLDEQGKRIKLSLDDEDIHQVPGMFSEGTSGSLDFYNKRWMVLFPL